MRIKVINSIAPELCPMVTCNASQSLIKIVCHSRRVTSLAAKLGWLPGASYRNLRNIRGVDQVGLIDIEWDGYNFKKHLEAVKIHRPLLTIAKDLVRKAELGHTLDQADELLQWSTRVVVVPKDPRLGPDLLHVIPSHFVLGYSVPTRYGRTAIPLEFFSGRAVHLLGGRPDVQRRIASVLTVKSLDVNRFTLDARFGDFFDGETFRPHPVGGYHRCLRDSIRNIEALWDGYGKEDTNSVSDQESETGRFTSNQETGSPEQRRSRIRSKTRT